MQRLDRTSKGGGVLLATKSNLIAKEEPRRTTGQNKCELTWVSVHVKGNPALYIGAFYRPHIGLTTQDQQYLAELDRSIADLPKNCQIVLGGDFNLPDIDWAKNTFITGGRYPATSRQMLDIANEHNLHQVVCSPTRGDNILDLLFTNIPTLVQSVNILPGLADHDIVSTEILTSPQRVKLPRRRVFLYKKGNFDLINDDLKLYMNSISSEMLVSMSANQLWTGFKSTLVKAMDKHIPSKMSRPNSSVPWFHQDHKRLAIHKRKAYDKAKQTGSLSDWEVYKNIRRLLDRSLRKSRSTYLHNVGENLATSNPRPFWRYIKSLRQSADRVSSLNCEHNIAIRLLIKLLANALNNQFLSVFPWKTVTGCLR